ncbi:hypothetical protein CQA53_10610 [Helicobacter didelphidarum]|uniref:Uncharacterized protein n=1 Tax=Helicobacter didelphidarum TaxID=2040648 RepID=A0A3D8I8K5_9HELI|nr:hypothetical protein [Helicobacter didelphidarum]RDU60881.1 hypothetical protein CQA53_10610 [Helicobacter didelphidarum]
MKQDSYKTTKRFDPFLLQGLPRINDNKDSINTIDYKRIKMYKHIFTLSRFFALMSCCFGVLVMLAMFDGKLKNKEFFMSFLPYTDILGILFFICYLIIQILILYKFISFRIKNNISLKNITPYNKTPKFSRFVVMIGVIVLCVLGFYVHIGFFHHSLCFTSLHA